MQTQRLEKCSDPNRVTDFLNASKSQLQVRFMIKCEFEQTVTAVKL
jgi:hypothetical protein